MDEFGQLKKTVTDLSPVMSSYLSKTGTRYHLHPELVNVGDTETCSLCVACLQLMNEEIEIEIEIEGIDPDSPDAEAKLDEMEEGEREAAADDRYDAMRDDRREEA